MHSLFYSPEQDRLIHCVTTHPVQRFLLRGTARLCRVRDMSFLGVALAHLIVD
jgi:hypothetical protein